jgi:predicted O-methyltransferase YrrM
MNYREYRQQRLEELRTTPRMPDGGVYRNHVDGLIDLLQETMPVSALEIGCAFGVSTETIALHSRLVWTVDCWIYPEAQRPWYERCGTYPHVHLLAGRSPEILAKLPAGLTFDLVYIDGDHEYQSVKADIAATLPLIKPGGVLAGHDWSAGGVQMAVLEFWRSLERAGLPQIYADGSWMIRL